MTPRNERFHRTDARLRNDTEAAFARARAADTITEEDAVLIRAFLDEAGAMRTISLGRRFKLAIILIGLRRFVPPFADCATTDIFQGIERVRSGISKRGTPFSQDSQSDYIRILKRFMVWLGENELASPRLNLAKVRKIQPPRYSRMTKTAGQLLSPTEIAAMIEACLTSRDRALVATLYDGGFRVGEIASLTWGQVEFNDWHAVVNVDAKTEYPRFIPLVMATPYLGAYRNDYPGEAAPDSYVFLTRAKQPLQYHGLVDQLRSIAERAGIEKHITPHLFRHSRITNLLREGFPESMIKLMLWGNISTAMFETYAHLTNDDIVQELAVRHGVKTRGAVRDGGADPVQCPRCRAIAGPTMRYCPECWLPLTGEATASLEDARRDLYRPEVLAEIVRRLQDGRLRRLE